MALQPDIDVERALKAFGDMTLKYRSFGGIPLRFGRVQIAEGQVPLTDGVTLDPLPPQRQISAGEVFPLLGSAVRESQSVRVDVSISPPLQASNGGGRVRIAATQQPVSGQAAVARGSAVGGKPVVSPEPPASLAKRALAAHNRQSTALRGDQRSVEAAETLPPPDRSMAPAPWSPPGATGRPQSVPPPNSRTSGASAPFSVAPTPTLFGKPRFGPAPAHAAAVPVPAAAFSAQPIAAGVGARSAPATPLGLLRPRATPPGSPTLPSGLPTGTRSLMASLKTAPQTEPIVPAADFAAAALPTAASAAAATAARTLPNPFDLMRDAPQPPEQPVAPATTIAAAPTAPPLRRADAGAGQPLASLFRNLSDNNGPAGGQLPGRKS